MLYTKYISSGPHGFREEDFFKFFPLCLREFTTPWDVASLDPTDLIGRIYVTLLHSKYTSLGPHGFREEDFLRFSHYKSMGAISRHGSHPDLRTVTIFINFQSPFNIRLHIKFEEI